MKISRTLMKSIRRDVGLALSSLDRETSPIWALAAAGLLETVAQSIREEVAAQQKSPEPKNDLP